MIDSMPDRYGEYARVGTRYSVLAFTDAYMNYKAYENGEELPPFDPTKAKDYFIESLTEDKTDYLEAGIRKCRNALYEEVQEYFNDLIVPRESKAVARSIKLAVLAIILTGEVT